MRLGIHALFVGSKGRKSPLVEECPEGERCLSRSERCRREQERSSDRPVSGGQYLDEWGSGGCGHPLVIVGYREIEISRE
jgi:hypothetical protein